MTNMEKFIEIMNETFNAKFTEKNISKVCCPCGAIKKKQYACKNFKCASCAKWWDKEYNDPKEVLK